MLVIEEHKITSPINDKLQQTSTIIHNIINEIKNINNIFRPIITTTTTSTTKCSTTSDDDVLDFDFELDIAMSDIVRSITSCDSIDQFIDQAIPTQSSTSSSSTTPSSCDSTQTSVTDNDIELLITIQGIVEAMNTTQHQLVRPCTVEVDTDMLDSIKDHLQSCFRLLDDNDDAEKYTHGLDHHVMCIGQDSYSLFNPISNEWTHVRDEGNKNIEYLFMSTVYARGRVYLFGGGINDEAEQALYSRFNLDSRRWDLQQSIDNVSGGYTIASCYDGNQLIYLVGGISGSTYLTRVDSFNIDTQQFTHVGDLNQELTATYLVHHDNILYCIGGRSKDNPLSGKCIYTFNLTTKEQTTVDLPTYVTSYCHDGRGMLYLYSKAFNRMSLSTMELVTLATPPHCPLRMNNMVYSSTSPSREETILLLQGHDFNFRYSIKHNEWTKINDNDPISKRDEHGMCVLYDKPIKQGD
ncbi:hypothetical protein SAMD00019534_052390 [Acytostelium subglobosum LB1]|uniref:hypothetical protein n=1 Tax=Acytostelium subglobosum LB1 TaxID=1410327 RepID=UPI000644CB7F|nr:hypothetical protein SAMD00019534_052390 [Acytostelium subglobosum LB1]GAM22064.1 hypothetical protein SAMD00019534_052390 [Acytostelium subglobosum LB1]|eukprot:XP_012755164.1 hypothetical protein SAMD00019534_052390 [Acytostelium subglobosum LB1]